MYFYYYIYDTIINKLNNTNVDIIKFFPLKILLDQLFVTVFFY